MAAFSAALTGSLALVVSRFNLSTPFPFVLPPFLVPPPFIFPPFLLLRLLLLGWRSIHCSLLLGWRSIHCFLLLGWRSIHCFLLLGWRSVRRFLLLRWGDAFLLGFRGTVRFVVRLCFRRLLRLLERAVLCLELGDLFLQVKQPFRLHQCISLHLLHRSPRHRLHRFD